MGREVVQTRLQGLNVSRDSKNLQLSEISDSLNMRLRKTGELEARPGYRLAGNSSHFDNKALGVPEVITDGKRMKWIQVYTQSRDLLTVCAIGNKVFLFDDSLNKFTLLYEAPGSAEVDVCAYLGYVLVTSHTSNLAILRQFSRNAFILNRGVKVIKSAGTISGSSIDFVTEDEIIDAGLQDIAVDQSSLYSASIDTIGAQVKAVTPTAEITNYVETSTHRYRTPFKVWLGADRRTGDDAAHLSASMPGLTISEQAFGTIAYGDFPNGEKQETLTFTRKAKRVVSSTGGNGRLVDGGVWSGSLISPFKIRRNTGSEVNFAACADGAWYSSMANDSSAVWIQTLRIVVQRGNISGNWSDTSTINFDGECVAHQNGGTIHIWKPDGSYATFANIYQPFESPPGSGVYFRSAIKILAHDGYYKTGIISGLRSQTDTTEVSGREFATGGLGLRCLNQVSYGWAIDRDHALFANVLYKSASGFTSETVYSFRRVLDLSVTSTRQFTIKIGALPAKPVIEGTTGVISHIIGSSDVSFRVTSDEFALSQVEIHKAYEYYLTSNSTGYTDEGAVQTGTVIFRPLRPYYRVETNSVGSTAKQDVNTTEPWRYNGSVAYKNNRISKQQIDVTFDVAYAHGETEVDYDITPAGAAVSRLRLRQFNKDNLDIKETSVDLYTEAATMLRVAKLSSIFTLHVDTWGQYLLASRRVVDQVEIFAEFDLAGYGTIVDMKGITDHNGRLYSIVLTNTGVYLFGIENDEIVEVSRHIVADVLDVAAISEGNHTDIYCLKAQTGATTFRLRIIDGPTGVAFDGTVYTTGNDYRINYDAGPSFPKMLAFVSDDSDQSRLIVADTAGTPTDVNRYLEFLINGGSAASYEKIVTDQSVSSLLQVRPFNTPTKPIIAASSSTNDRTGRFMYFCVAKEKDAGGSVLFESYASDPSIIAQVTSKTLSISLGGEYPQKEASATAVDLTIYRVELRTTDTLLKSTDFIELETVALAAGTVTGYWKLALPWVDHYVSDDIDFVPAGPDAITGKENYRGYTRFYPCCAFVATQGNVVYLANDIKYRNNIYFSDLLDPTQWRPQNTISSQLFSGDDITALIPNNGVWVFTRDSVGVVNGVGTSVSYQDICKEIGCVDARTVQIIGGAIWALTERGFYRFSGYEYKKFDVPVDRISSQFVYANAIVSFADPIELEYRVIYDRNKALCYSIPLDKWFIHQYPYDLMLYGFNRENALTGLPEAVAIVRNLEPRIGQVYRMLAEDRDTIFDYVSGDGENVTTEKVDHYVVTKELDMDNAWAEKIWRRIHGDFIKSHGILGEISINDGEFVPMVDQTKKAYFTDVPVVWYRFNELYGSRILDFGTRGVAAKAIGDVERNADGKIDRTSRLPAGSYINAGDVPQMPNGATILFWANQEDGGSLTPIAFADQSAPSQNAVDPADVDYTNADFAEQLTDAPGKGGAITAVSDTGGLLTLEVIGHGITVPPYQITILGLDAGLDGPVDIVSVGTDTIVVDLPYSAVTPAGFVSTPGDFHGLVLAKTAAGVDVKCGAYAWRSTGAVAAVATDFKQHIGQDTGAKDWWSDAAHPTPDSGAITLEVPSGFWDSFATVANGTKTLRIPNVGIGGMVIGTSFFVG